MDDFLALSQRNQDGRGAARRTLFECIDAVLRPLAPTDGPCRKEPNSTKKLAKGDAAWETRKVIFGSLLNTMHHTIELPMHCLERLQELLDSFPQHQRHTSC